MSIEEREQEVDRLVRELYVESHIEYIPMYPWVFVRVLPKHQQIGLIITPDSVQNKPVHEGIVLSTWRPFTKEIGKMEKGIKVTRTIEFHSDLHIGKHVMFLHHSGVPIPGFDDKYYRSVMERGWEKEQGGGIFGCVEFGEKALSPHEGLTSIIDEVLHPTELGTGSGDYEASIRLLSSKIEDRFHLIDNQRSSVTLSGI